MTKTQEMHVVEYQIRAGGQVLRPKLASSEEAEYWHRRVSQLLSKEEVQLLRSGWSTPREKLIRK